MGVLAGLFILLLIIKFDLLTNGKKNAYEYMKHKEYMKPKEYMKHKEYMKAKDNDYKMNKIGGYGNLRT